MADTADVSSVLNNLIETCKDGEEGFRKAASEAKDSSLKQLFTKYSTQRAGYAAELQQLVQSSGEKPAESGSVAASLHRGWLSLKEKVSASDDKALVEECERGEDSAMAAYKEAVAKTLPTNIQSVVQRQFAGVQAAHNVIRDMKHSGSTSVPASALVS